MNKLNTLSNKDTLNFYKELPFNVYSSPEKALSDIKLRNSIIRYGTIISDIITPDMNCVDLGCGCGWFVNSLEYHYGISLIGVDYNKIALEHAEKVNKLFNGKSTFIESDLFEFIPDTKFDLVSSIGVLHHTNDALYGLRHICRNVVTPGGYIFIGLYHKYGRKPFFDYFDELKKDGLSENQLFIKYKELHSNQVDETQLMSWFRDQVIHPHETHHTLEEVNAIMKEEGMVIEKTSVNSFSNIYDINELFIIEKTFYDKAIYKLNNKQYFPGFFVFLAKKV
jgi:SAM-dependent methyltransferase